MPVSGRTPSGWPGRWINWRAGRIADPVAKLRFLRQAARRPRARIVLSASTVVACLAVILATKNAVAPTTIPATVTAKDEQPPSVWLVELRGDREIYSNGLHVETAYAVPNTPRRARPAGIVYHTSESQLVDLTEAANQRLRLLGRGLLEYVRNERAYHYMIDRFGRVFRVVDESHVAFHAGNSVWADEHNEYVNLNDQFLAVSFETQTRTGDQLPEVTEAQTRAARVLTEMLRARYRIAAGNCVTHAQVSINPRNFHVGWHTDWAGNFPFEALGLPDNYQRPLPAVARFGFSYDATFFAATGAQMWRGVVAAEDQLRAAAARERISVAELRQRLRQHYLDQVSKEKRS